MADKSEYIIVSGHHPTSFCINRPSHAIKRLDGILRNAGITAYLFGLPFYSNSVGHKHAASFSQSPNGVGYIQSGNAVRTDVSCKANRFSSVEGGFARGIISDTGFQVQYFNENSKVLFTSPIMAPRR
jgi:hypothetical protein